MTSGETITFSFELTQPGAALAVFVFDGVENEFELTNVCNPLGDMLSAMAAMVTNPSQLWEGENTAGFIWYCESESYNWTLTAKKGGRLEIRITQSCEFFGDDEVEIVKGECDEDLFISKIVGALDVFIKDSGLLNYQQVWQANEFPLTYFLILKKHLIDNGKWQESGGGTTLADESALLLG
ncbi:MAG: hypothetical protein II951_10370 [Bacteroidales bacterium]|nr:hypothetical protein [Bacteroidales bacterium]